MTGFFSKRPAAMALTGVLLGAPLGRPLRSAGDYIGAGLIALLGAYVLLSADRDDPERLISIDRAGSPPSDSPDSRSSRSPPC